MASPHDDAKPCVALMYCIANTIMLPSMASHATQWE